MNSNLSLSVIISGLILCSASNAKADNSECLQTVMTHGFLSRAQFQCGFIKYNQQLLEAAKECSGNLTKIERTEALKFGMERFDKNEDEKGRAALCSDILAKFPTAFVKDKSKNQSKIGDTSAIRNTNISFKCKAFIITNEQSGKSKALTDNVFDYYFLNGNTASEIASTGKKIEYRFVDKIVRESTVYKYARQDGSVTSEIFVNFQNDGKYILASSLSAQATATITTVSNCVLNH